MPAELCWCFVESSQLQHLVISFEDPRNRSLEWEVGGIWSVERQAHSRANRHSFRNKKREYHAVGRGRSRPRAALVLRSHPALESYVGGNAEETREGVVLVTSVIVEETARSVVVEAVAEE